MGRQRNHGNHPRVYLASETFGGYVPPQEPRVAINIAIRALEECATGRAGSAESTLAVIRRIASEALEAIQPERKRRK